MLAQFDLHPEHFELQAASFVFVNVVFIAPLGQTFIHFPHLIHSALFGVLYTATFMSHFLSHNPHFVDVYKRQSRGRALKARVKIQERLEANRIKHPFVDIKQPYINLETNNEIEEEIIALKTDNLGISFDEVLLQNVNFEIKSNDKVAIIGTNGVGKTTLLKQIFKNNNDAIKIDENIKLAYLSQMQSEVVNESNTILQEFYDVGFETYGEIRRYLGRYGFSSDILTQKIESLSGGEKNILQLAKVSASKANMPVSYTHLKLYYF